MQWRVTRYIPFLFFPILTTTTTTVEDVWNTCKRKKLDVVVQSRAEDAKECACTPHGDARWLSGKRGARSLSRLRPRSARDKTEKKRRAVHGFYLGHVKLPLLDTGSRLNLDSCWSEGFTLQTSKSMWHGFIVLSWAVARSSWEDGIITSLGRCHCR